MMLNLSVKVCFYSLPQTLSDRNSVIYFIIILVIVYHLMHVRCGVMMCKKIEEIIIVMLQPIMSCDMFNPLHFVMCIVLCFHSFMPTAVVMTEHCKYFETNIVNDMGIIELHHRLLFPLQVHTIDYTVQCQTVLYLLYIHTTG